MTDSEPTRESSTEFSLVLGGALHRLYLALGLGRDTSDPKYRRTAVVTALAWLPLLVLSIVDGHAYGSGIDIPFLSDIAAHTRFLVALPALLLGESIAHDLIAPRIKMFITRNIIVGDDIAKFRAAIDSAHRMRDSALLEGALVAVVYAFGIWIWGSQIASFARTWYAAPDSSGMHLTTAGYWLIFVSLPIFQFLLLRWYVRVVIWGVFLFRVSRLGLRLVGTHSDRSAGLGFLGQCAYGFCPLLFAEGALLSAYIAGEVLFAGRTLEDHKLEVVALIPVFVIMALAPLVLFTPRMVKAKWRDLLVYGALATKYVDGFDRRWIQEREPPGKDLLGADDIQSMADLSNSYAVLQSMRPIPFEIRDVLFLLAATIVPLLPLVFFVFSVDEILEKLVKVLV